DLLEVLVVDAETLLHVGAEILDHHVGLPHHSPERGEPRLGLEVEGDRALVAVQVLEVGTVARAAGGVAGPFQLGRRLNLDDVGAPVGELAHAGRARAYPGQVQDGEPLKRARGPWMRHFQHQIESLTARRGAPSGLTFPDIPRVVYRG